jgi:protein-S-isoprenylcysteine O-methyltransferase Ste14
VPALAILLVLSADVLIHRIFVEEAVLTEVIGRAYADYPRAPSASCRDCGKGRL